MTALDSKWAHQDGLPSTEILKEPKKPTSGLMPALNALLVSKWASAERDKAEEPAKPSKPAESTRSAKAAIPTPPSSAGAKENSEDDVSVETKLGVLALLQRIDTPPGKGKSTEDAVNETFKGRYRAEKHNKNTKLQQTNEDRALAGRVLGEQHMNDGQKQSSHRRNRPADPHENLSSNQMSKDNKTATMGARALALRIGVPAKNDTGNKVPKAKDPPHRASNLRSRNQPLNAQPAPPAREIDQIDETLKAEVQAMFEKIADTTTSWADIDDEWG